MTVLQVIALETPAKKPKPVGAQTFKTKQHFGSTGVLPKLSEEVFGE